jgi:hypothetical protein
MSTYKYRDLDPSKHEIRVLRFLEAADTNHPNLVHCTLVQVSLDDLLPAYEDFLEEMNLRHLPSYITSWWLQADRSPKPRLDAGAFRTCVAAWRYYVGMVHSNRLVDLKNVDIALMDVMNVDLARLPDMPQRMPILQAVSSQNSLDAEIETSEVSMDDTASTPPRFTWGDFEAVSYCWESDLRDKAVVVDDIIVQVPTNLEALLQHLQRLPEARAGMAFWVDGLCINQNDESDEKNHQVQLMKRIYAEAFSVVVWLGPGDAESDLAIDFMMQVSDIQVSRFTEQELLTWISAKGHPRAPWVSLLALWSRNYFQRMWIIQELAMNFNMSLFICGGRQFPRLALHNASDFCQNFAGTILQALMDTASLNTSSFRMNPLDVWSTAYNVHRLISLRASNTDLETVLDLARKSNVKDPRDKIYGLLGLLPKPIAALIEPNYSKTKEEVYVEFATVMLRHCSRLDALLSWCESKERNNLPTWVPDWTTPFKRYHLRWFRNRMAGADMQPIWSISPDGMELCCKGLQISKVDCVGVPSSQTLPYRTVARSNPEPGHSYTHFGQYRDRAGLKWALCRTLLHAHALGELDGDLTNIYWIDWNELVEPDPWNFQMENFWTFGMPKLTQSNDANATDPWRLFDSFRQTNAHFPIFGLMFKHFFPNMRSYTFHAAHGARSAVDEDGWTHSPHEMTTDHAYNMRLATVGLSGRKLITTQNGFLGLAPDETQLGDTIAVLYGCNYPVVLRRSGNGFRYIGECYIDGLMDGEAVAAQMRGEYQEETIVIL